MASPHADAQRAPEQRGEAPAGSEHRHVRALLRLVRHLRASPTTAPTGELVAALSRSRPGGPA